MWTVLFLLAETAAVSGLAWHLWHENQPGRSLYERHVNPAAAAKSARRVLIVLPILWALVVVCTLTYGLT
ncbi:hypothetical protein Back2_10450 [Nocardioides baekrokdamisoli]|uniref:Uncharacterized protein n=1 Tax=Nocardioides baekrokdamisoli TaxID=1804624 RepID=A0A3G9IZI9_9ACTN|nr:hypothetical protein Back2_10450 [Nocardioides baekrokdamisoli]